MTFPQVRLQRYRTSSQVRAFARETTLCPQDFIAPFFVHENLESKREIPKMPGVYQHTLSSLVDEVGEMRDLGLTSVLLFGIPRDKDCQGSSAYEKEGIVQRAARLLKKSYPDLVLIGDCCLCEYTTHGHCFAFGEQGVEGEETLQALGKIAVSYAEAGVDLIAPSGMVDGMVKKIRSELDRAGFCETGILSYAVKYASNFYSPFRDAVESSSCFRGDRKFHQLSPSQSREALREALLDIEEGADYLMVKPALPYLDIVKQLKEKTLLPVIVYHTSGEYAMIRCSAKEGILDERGAFEEIFLSMKRAGADRIITYYAKQMLQEL